MSGRGKARDFTDVFVSCLARKLAWAFVVAVLVQVLNISMAHDPNTQLRPTPPSREDIQWLTPVP